MRSGTGVVLAAALAGGVMAACVAPAWASSPGVITTVAGGPGRGVARNVSQVPASVAATSDGTLYVGDLHGVVRVLHDGSDYEAVTAGVGVTGFAGDRHYAPRAELSGVQGVAAGPDGNVLVSDYGNDRIRMVAGTTGVFYGQQVVRGDIYTIAGDGGNGFAGDGGKATSAELAAPQGLAADAAGNVLIADSVNQRIRVVAAATGTFYGQAMTAGDIYTIAGDGTSGFAGDGGPATAAELWAPADVAVDPRGNVVIADTINNRIRVVAASTGTFYGQAMTAGDIYTVAGSGQFGFLGDGQPATIAWMRAPMGVAVDAAGNLVIADTGNLRIRVVAASTGTFYGRAMTAGDIYTVAGNGQDTIAGEGGPATSASLGSPRAVTVDRSGNIAAAVGDLDRVRVVAAATGTFYGQAMTAGDLYTAGGNGQTSLSGDSGGALSAELEGPTGVAVDGSGDYAILDHNEVRLVPASVGTLFGRTLNPGRIYGLAGNGHAGYTGDGGPAKAATVRAPGGAAFDSAGNLVIADGGNNRIRVVAGAMGTFYGRAMTTGDIYTVAGNGTGGFAGDGGPATAAELFTPMAVAADAAGNLVIADMNNNGVRVVAASAGTFYGRAMTAGDIYTIAGGGIAGFGGDGGPAGAARLAHPHAVAIDAAGNVIIADTDNLRIRVIAATTGTFYGQAMTAGDIYTVAGNGAFGFSGDGGPATSAAMAAPRGAAIDTAGNLVIADTANSRIRVVAASAGTFYGQAMTAGDIYTVAGTGQPGFGGDGGAATAAELAAPGAVAVGPAGDILVADPGNNRIRQVGG
jgi:NHL repeat-containing protein